MQIADRLKLMKEQFIQKKFRANTLELIGKCNSILESYETQGFDMTLRQLYYQLVQANEIPNNQREYDRLGDIVNNARLAGLIDWSCIVDRTRSLKSLATWSNPSEIVSAVAEQYRVDKWEGQQFRPEVWIEKEALAGVFERVCNEMEVPLFSCRGYTSVTAMYATARRFRDYREHDQTPYILHFGDHDPSGIDMTRDITFRLSVFRDNSKVERMALNIDQIEEHTPPPNFCKLTDSRSAAYISNYGRESWELDALQPDVLAGLVRREIESLIDDAPWRLAAETEKEQRAILGRISDKYDEVVTFVNAGIQ
jgi:hypothetical protein